MTARALATKGISDVAPLDLGRTDKSIALEARQPTPVGTYQKFLLLIGSDAKTALITANLPLSDGGDVSPLAETIRGAFRSAALSESIAPRELPYALTYSGPFKRAGDLAGAGEVYTLSGKLPEELVKDPEPGFIIAHSLSALGRFDRAELASRLVMAIEKYRGITVKQTAPITINGVSGIQHLASATDNRNGIAVSILHTTLFPESGGYVRLLGITPTREAERYLPVFQELAASFRMKK